MHLLKYHMAQCDKCSEFYYIYNMIIICDILNIYVILYIIIIDNMYKFVIFLINMVFGLK